MKTRTKKTTKRVTSIDLVRALMTEHDPNVYGPLIEAADEELPRITKAGLGEDEIIKAVERITLAVESEFARALKLIRQHQEAASTPGPVVDAISNVQWMQVNAAVALGMVIGLRLGGAR